MRLRRLGLLAGLSLGLVSELIAQPINPPVFKWQGPCGASARRAGTRRLRSGTWTATARPR